LFCLFLLRSLGSLPLWERLLGADYSAGAAKGSLGQILAVPLLEESSLDTVQASGGSSLHGHTHHSLGGLVGGAGPLGGEDESLVVGGSGDAHGLLPDQSIVSLRVGLEEVAGLGGERLLHAPLLQKVGGVVPDHGPGNIFGNHFEFFLLKLPIN